MLNYVFTFELNFLMLCANISHTASFCSIKLCNYRNYSEYIVKREHFRLKMHHNMILCIVALSALAFVPDVMGILCFNRQTAQVGHTLVYCMCTIQRSDQHARTRMGEQ